MVRALLSVGTFSSAAYLSATVLPHNRHVPSPLEEKTIASGIVGCRIGPVTDDTVVRHLAESAFTTAIFLFEQQRKMPSCFEVNWQVRRLLTGGKGQKRDHVNSIPHQTLKVKKTWSLSSCEEPSGLPLTSKHDGYFPCARIRRWRW